MSEVGKPKGIKDPERPTTPSAVDSAVGSENGFHRSDVLDQLISLFADTVPQSIWVTDALGNVKYLNKHWHDYSGTSALPATAGDIVAESVHPDDAPGVMAAFREAIRTGEGFEIEQRNRSATGEYRWFLNRANPYRDPDTGEIMFWFGVGLDIHDRKLAEAALRDSEERLRLVQAAGGIGSFDYYIQDDRAVCSREYYELVGLPEGSTINKRIWAELIHPDDRATALETLEKAILDRKPFDLEYRVVRKDTGQVRWLSGRASIVLDRDGRPRRFVGGNADITEQRTAREEEKFLFEITEAIRVAVDPDDLLGEISDKLGKYLRLHRCLFNEIDLVSDTETVHRDYARDGESVAGKHKVSVYSPEASARMASGQTIVNHDSENDPRTAKYFESTYKPAKELAYVTVPMMRNGRWVASLWCSDDRPRQWSNREVALLENIAERAWVAVERLRSEEGIRKQRNRLRALAETARALSEAEGLESQLQVLTDEARRILGGCGAMTGLPISGDLSEMVTAVSRSSESSDDDDTLSFFSDATELFRVVYEGTAPIRLTEDEIAAHPAFKNLHRSGRAIHDWIAAPIVAESGSNIGVIQVYDKLQGEFTAEDEAVLVQLAQFASGSIERSRAREAAELNQKTFLDLVENAPFGVYIVDSELRIAAMNSGSKSGSFANVRPVIGRKLSEALKILWPEPVAEEIVGHFKRTLDTGEPYYSRDFTHLRSDIATVESYEWELHRIMLPGGTPGVVCYYYDSTKLRDAESREKDQIRRALNATAKFETVFNQSGIFAGIVDLEGNLIEINDIAVNQSGFSREEVLDKPFWEAGWWSGSPEAADQIRTATSAALGGESFHSVLSYRWAVDPGRAIDLSLHPIRNEKGEIIYLSATGIDITERKKADDALRESEERYRALTELSPQIVYMSRPDGSMTYVNQYALEWTGKKFEDLAGDRWVRLIHPDHRDRIFNVWKTATILATEYELDIPFRYVDGTYRTLYNRALPIKNDRGEVLYWIGTALDVEDRKQAEGELREAENRYRSLVTVLTDVAWSADAAGEFAEVQNAWGEYTGQTWDQMRGSGWIEAIHPDDREAFRRIWTQQVSGHVEHEARGRFWSAEARGWRYFVARAAPIIDESGEVRQWVGSFTDVHERTLAEQELSAQRRLYKSVTDNASTSIFIMDERQQCTFMNPAAEQLTGFTLSEIQGRPLHNFVHHTRPEGIPFPLSECPIEQAFPNRSRVQGEEIFVHKEGHFYNVYFTASPLLDDAGEAIGTVIEVQNITARKRAEQALRESELRFRQASDSAPVLIWMTDASNEAIWFNKAWLDFRGRSLEEEAGSGWLEGIHPDDEERCRNIHSMSFGNKQEFTLEYRLRRADGEFRWVLNRGVPRFTPDGTFLGFIGSSIDIHDRRSVESALRRSEARLQLATRIGNYGTWDSDFVEDRQVWSEKLFEIFGISPTRDRVVTQDLYEGYIYPRDLESLYRANEEAISSGGHLSTEYRIRKADTGETRWLFVAAQYFYGPGGQPIRAVGITQDITERKEIAERIKNSESQLRLVTDSIPALVSYIDKDKRYRFVNQKYTEWFGLDPAEIIGRTMAEILGPGAWEQLEHWIDKVLLGEPASFESWVEYNGAGRKYVHVSYVPDLNDDGEVLGFYALVTDLTAQKVSEEMLRSTEDRMRTISESFTDYAIISMDSEGRIESWNRGARNIFGFEPDEIVGKPGSVIFTPEDVEKGVPESELRRAQESGRASDERWHVRKDGSRFFASGVTAPLYIGERLSGFAKIATDLTEKKRNAEALQRAYDEMENRVLERTRELASMNETLMREISERQTAERQKIELLKRLVSGQEEERRRIARDLHDHLGQRLTALRLKLASLREACAEHDDLYARATRLQQIAELIDSEVSFLAWELRPSTLDELGLIEAMGAFVKEWSRHYEIDAEFHSAGLGETRLDHDAETHLYRITQESLNNIYKHAKATKVNVLVEKAGKEVVLIIEDDGTGFTQAEARRQRKGDRGLGLTGMQERADLIGGTLEIESEIGKGTTIYVRIPVETDRGNKK